MAGNYSDFNSFLDYKEEYTKELQKQGITDIKYKGDKLICRCPFHTEKTPSFEAMINGDKKGVFYCFGCGEKGHFIDFYSKLNNVDTKEGTKQILKAHGRYTEPATKKNTSKASKPKEPINEAYNLTVQEYSQYTKLPLDYLTKVFNIANKLGWIDGHKYNVVNLPAYDKAGHPYRGRFRGGQKEFRWVGNKSIKMGVYGEWLLQDNKQIILCEGESDTQSLYYMGFQAVGFYGGGSVNTTFEGGLFRDFQEIIIHSDSDTPGENFIDTLQRQLKASYFVGIVKVIRCKSYDVTIKDPSDIYKKYGQEKGRNIIQELINKAEKINLYTGPAKWINGALRMHRWTFENGALCYEKVNTQTGEIDVITIFQGLLTISDIFENVENQDHYLKLQYSEHKSIIDKAVNFTDRGRLLNTAGSKLLGLGSDNTKEVALYINTLVSLNKNDILKPKPAIDRLGWYNDNFYPYSTDCTVFSISDKLTEIIKDLNSPVGNYNTSINLFNKFRHNIIPRILVDLSLASLFIRMLDNGKITSFITEVIGLSDSGKTQALIFLSTLFTSNHNNYLWTMNNTNNSMLKYLNFLSSLPFIIREAENISENARKNMNSTIMQLAEGVGRGRNNSENKLQALEKWYNLIFIAGENRLVDNTAGGGTENRLLTLDVANDTPLFTITNKSLAMYEVDAFVNEACENAGHIVKRLFDKIQPTRTDYIKSIQEVYNASIKKLSTKYISTHSPKTIKQFALIEVGEYIYKGLEGTDNSQIDINYCIKRFAKTKIEVDKARRAFDYFVDYITDNTEHLTKVKDNGKVAKTILLNATKEPFNGYIEPLNGWLHISPTRLREILQNGGFSYDSTVKSWIDNKRMTTKSILIYVNGANKRVWGVASKSFKNLTITDNNTEIVQEN